MDKDEKSHINENLDSLIENTSCSVPLLAKLISKDVLCQDEEEVILSKQTAHGKARELYNILMRKHNGFNHLKAALSEERQTGAVQILESKGWTTHGIIEFNKNKILSRNYFHMVFEGRMGWRGTVAVMKAKAWNSNTEEMLKDLQQMCSLPSDSNILHCLHFDLIKGKPKIIAAFEMWTSTLQECVKNNRFVIKKDSMASQITKGLAYLHSNKIIHGNLNPTNIYIFDKGSATARVKLGGFGHNISSDQASLGPDSDGLYWLSPEIIYHSEQLENKDSFTLTCESDSFVLGCIFYFMLSNGKHPFGQGVLCPSNIVGGEWNQLSPEATNDNKIVASAIPLLISRDLTDRVTCGKTITLLNPNTALLSDGNSSCDVSAAATMCPILRNKLKGSGKMISPTTHKNEDLIKQMEMQYTLQAEEILKPTGTWKEHEKITYKQEALVAIDGRTEVYLGKTISGEIAAVKKSKCGKETQSIVLDEVEKFRRLKANTHVAQILEAAVALEKSILIATEAHSYTLQECVLNNIYPISKHQTTMQICFGLQFLHENSIAHGNLMPKTILIVNRNEKTSVVKIADYIPRIVQELEKDFKLNTCWKAPELHFRDEIRPDGHSAEKVLSVTTQCDIFTLGCLMYYLHTSGEHPFGKGDQAIKNIQNHKYWLDENAANSWEYNYLSMIEPMISFDGYERPTCNAILEGMKDIVRGLDFGHKARLCYETYTSSMNSRFEQEGFFASEKALIELHENMVTSILLVFNISESSQERRIRKSLEELYMIYQRKNSVINYSHHCPPALGIDIGINNCRIAVYHRGKTTVLPNALGHLATPSYSRFEEKDKYIVGYEAFRHRLHFPSTYTISSVFRLLEQSRLVRSNVFACGKGIVPGGNATLDQIKEMCAILLRKLKDRAEEELGIKGIYSAVLTVPVSFTDKQCNLVIEAAQSAGLAVINCMDQPVAIMHGLTEKIVDTSVKNTLVYDLGRDTLQVTIVRTRNNIAQVLGSAYSEDVGGINVDRNILKYCYRKSGRPFKKPLRKVMNPVGETSIEARTLLSIKARKLLAICEQAKIDLTTDDDSRVFVYEFLKDKDLCVLITKEDLVKMNRKIFMRTITVANRALESASLSCDAVNEICFIGRSTRIPGLQKVVLELCTNAKSRSIPCSEETAVQGAALNACYLKCCIDKNIPRRIGVFVKRKASLRVELSASYLKTMEEVFEAQ